MLHMGKRSGFTLVEVMVSLVIFLVASMGLLPLLLTNMQASQEISIHTKARQFAGELMAELQVQDYGSLAGASGVILIRDDFEIQQQIDPDTPSRGQSRITVTTQWQNRGQNHSYQLQTIRSAP